MINSKPPTTSRPQEQLGIFDKIISDSGPALKAAMKEAISRSSLSRSEIVDAMNALASVCGITCGGRGQKVTDTLLDKWVASGASGYHIPIRLLPVFCRAAGSNLPLRVYASFFKDIQVVSDDDFKMLEWAKTEISARRNRKEATQLAREIGL